MEQDEEKKQGTETVKEETLQKQNDQQQNDNLEKQIPKNKDCKTIHKQKILDEISQLSKESIENYLNNEDNKQKKFIQEIHNIHYHIDGNLNVVKAKTVNGGSFFGNLTEGTKKYEKDLDPVFDLTKPEEVMNFIKYYETDQMLLYLFVVTCLEVVEVSKLNEITELLRKQLLKNRKEEEALFSVNRIHSKTWIVEHLGLTDYVVLMNTESGIVEKQCIGYEEQKLKQIRRIIWSEYIHQYRYDIVQWLLQLREQKSYPLFVCAVNALAYFSSLDYAYARDYIIPAIRKRMDKYGIIDISNILSVIAKKEQYNNNVRNLIQYWINSDDTDSWIIGLRLYISGYQGVKRSDLIRKMYHFFTVEFYGDEVERWLNYCMALARESNMVIPILYEAMGEVFATKKKMSVRENLCYLLIKMYLSELMAYKIGNQEFQLIKAFENKECRKTISAFYHYFWSKYSFRKMLQTILDCYILLIEKEKIGLESLKVFFRTIAFSGEKQDYDNTMFYLCRGKNQEDSVKIIIYNYLYSILKKRRKDNKEDGNLFSNR